MTGWCTRDLCLRHVASVLAALRPERCVCVCVCVVGLLRRFEQSFSHIRTMAACYMIRDSNRVMSVEDNIIRLIRCVHDRIRDPYLERVGLIIPCYSLTLTLSSLKRPI